METQIFTTFETKEGEVIVAKSSIALIEELHTNNYRITLKEKRPDGQQISFLTEISHYVLVTRLIGAC
ncbi:MAG: hypothetical protein WCM76_06175 [Bacteroidota bacterium]